MILPAHGQDAGSVSTYRLPDPKASPTPRLQGPVDPDNPYSAPTITPPAQPDASATTAPRITLPAPQPTERARPRTERDRAAATATRTDSRTPEAPAPVASLPAPTEATPEPVAPTPAPQPSPAASENPAPTTTSPPAIAGSSLWIIGGIAAVLTLAVAAWLLVRRRRAAERAVADQEAAWAQEPEPSPAVSATPAPIPVAASLAPDPAAPVTPPIAPLMTPPIVPMPEPAGSEPARNEALALAVTFSAPSLRLSLVYATLQYQLEITNTGADLPGPLHIRADLASAHAALGTREQLAPSPAQLEAKHVLPHLALGESATLKGEVRVPLQQVRPVMKGQASFLVPLVRFCILGEHGAAIRRVFTAGPRDPGSGAIASVRLDAGPRNLRDLDVREIEAARAFTLDLAEASG